VTQEYDNTNKGAAWPNKRRSAPTHADYTGNMNVEGREYWLNVWVKKQADGQTRLNIQIKEKQPRAASTPAPLEDDIPF